MSTYLADNVEDSFVDGPSARFVYRRSGPHGGVPLLLLQRFRRTIDWWDSEFVDYLATDRKVILFDNVSIGYSTGEPRDSLDGFADGAIEFIDALGLTTVDLLGWSLGGIVAQAVTHRRSDLVRKLVVAGSAPVGPAPGQPEMNPEVLRIIAKSDADADDLLFLFHPETEAAATGQRLAVGNILALPFDEVRSTLRAIKQPVLYANGMHDVMIPALASYVAVQHLDTATLVLYSEAGHAFLFQLARAFATEVSHFLDG